MMTDTYFITMTTRGSWLHGDERGSFERNGKYLPPSIDRFEQDKALLNQPPFAFTPAMIDVVKQAFQEVAAQRGWKIYALTVQEHHAHVVLWARHEKGENVRNALKSKATMRLRRANWISPQQEPWTRLGNIIPVRDSVELNSICQYINNHPLEP